MAAEATGDGAGHLVITVAAVVFRDGAGRLLSVRKRGTSRFMLPGGKLEPGEAPVDTAVREIAEELGLRLYADRLVVLGEFESDAANEPGHLLRSTVFTWPDVIAHDAPQVAAEIEELRWATLEELESDPRTAPMTALNVIPLLR
ncbi:NUDIX hydrolase [Nocardioides sp. Kera G14]|uniref:NUDIX hydrolase n=1 Tax=Nocardioides sp. Kera G14 TaxID=2884264 RepID=UPI001D0FA5A2|nr:NUDIX domain-containing protein [Nocardioides sp. Kera G14]UDY23175.1 NUDIX domain-containing protein [Nocardioides sp. Kera G14]